MRKVLNDAAVESGQGFTMPPPVGGWNARDALVNMPATDAIQLDNWFPGPSAVAVRPGMTLFATLPANTVIDPHNIRTLMSCALPGGTSKLFAACEDGIYDATAGGAIAGLDSAATTNDWQYINFNVAGVNYLWCCAGDGTNGPRIYNSTTDTWTVLTGASTPALTGITPTDAANISIFKSRVILTQRNSLSFWYGPLGSVGGAYSEFALGTVFRKGGYLVATGNWTLDAGSGLDDLFVAITSEGEVAIYKGADPSTAATFALVGIYNIGRPVGKRCMFPLANDLGVLTEQGLWPLSKALLSSSIDKRPALTDKIQPAFNLYYQNFSTKFGWQPLLFSKGPAIIVNVPLGNSVSYQFVMNSITGAWCRFTGWSAECMVVSGGELYYALGNKLYKAWYGKKDYNSAITAYAKQAFTYGPTRVRAKRLTLVKPVMTSENTLKIGLGLDTDFNVGTGVSGTTLASLSALSLFDTAVYGTAVWAGASTTINKWKTVRGKVGKSFSLKLQVQVKDIAVTWSATDYIFEVGGLFG